METNQDFHFESEIIAAELEIAAQIRDDATDLTFEQRLDLGLLSRDEEMDIQLGFSFLELRSATSRVEEALKHFGVECEAEIAQLRELTEELNKRYDAR